MPNNKRDKIIYWILTALVILPMLAGGIPELFTSGPELVIQSLQKMGYPLYLMKILGLAKILGSIAIISGYSPRLKEWAYAGFTFDLLGATASHILADDSENAAPAFILFLILMGSYFYWNKLKAQMHGYKI